MNTILIFNVFLAIIILDVCIWITPVVSKELDAKVRTISIEDNEMPTLTTKTPKTRRTKKKIRRSPKTSPTTSKKRVTKTLKKEKINWALVLTRFKEFYCMKDTECTNEHLYFEREPKRECAVNFLDGNDIVWFDHRCSVWATNCLEIGMFFIHDRDVCEKAPATKFIDEDYLDPPRTIKFAVE